MFDGQAENAMRFYASLSENGQIEKIDHYQAGEQGTEGTIKHATLRLGDQALMCIDSPSNSHSRSRRPSHSSSNARPRPRLDQLFARLSDGGKILMPLDAYPFSIRFGWLADRYGVSWQPTLGHNQ